MVRRTTNLCSQGEFIGFSACSARAPGADATNVRRIWEFLPPRAVGACERPLSRRALDAVNARVYFADSVVIRRSDMRSPVFQPELSQKHGPRRAAGGKFPI